MRYLPGPSLLTTEMSGDERPEEAIATRAVKD